MKAKVTVTDEQGIVLGQFEIDRKWIGRSNAITFQAIGDAVVEQLPGGIRFLQDDGKPVA